MIIVNFIDFNLSLHSSPFSFNSKAVISLNSSDFCHILSLSTSTVLLLLRSSD